MNKEMCNLAFYVCTIVFGLSRVMYKYIALADVFRALEAPQNVLFPFFLLFSFLSFFICTYVHMYWARRGPSPPFLTKIHIFLMYISRIELEEPAKKRSVRSLLPIRELRISQCWAILKNIRVQPTYAYAIYCLK